MAHQARKRDLAAWRAMSPEEREIARLDDAIAVLEAELVRRSLRPGGQRGRNALLTEIAERAALPRAEVARVLDALREVVSERTATGAQTD